MYILPAPCALIVARTLNRRPLAEHQIVCRIDQADVRQRLRKVTRLPALNRIVFFGEQPYVITQLQKPLKQGPRLIVAALHGKIVSQPKTARQKRSLSGRQTVNARLSCVALDETVLHQLSLDRLDSATHARVMSRQESDHWNYERRGVERIRI